METSVGADVSKTGPNTSTTVTVEHTNGNVSAGASWSKVVHGPGKSKPSVSVGAKIRF